MRKILSVLMFSLLFLGMFGIVLANNDNSSLDSSLNEDDSNNSSSDNETKIEEDSEKDSNLTYEIKRIKLEERERIRELKNEIEEIKDERREKLREIKSEEGKEIRTRIREINKEHKEIIQELRDKKKELRIQTRLEIREMLNKTTNVTFYIVNISNGSEQRIKIIPERLYNISLERFKSKNFTVEIIEIKYRNIPRVVYHLQSNHSGRFIGLWKIRAKYEASVDPETGEEINFHRPWWAFLITGDAPDLPGENDNETQTNDDNETNIDNDETENENTNETENENINNTESNETNTPI